MQMEYFQRPGMSGAAAILGSVVLLGLGALGMGVALLVAGTADLVWDSFLSGSQTTDGPLHIKRPL